MVSEFAGREEVSEPFRFEVGLLSHDFSADFEALIGKPCRLSWGTAEDAAPRFVHGIVASIAEEGRDPRFARYVAEVVPALWRLKLSADCRIFQHKSVPEIVTQVLRQGGVVDFEFRLFGRYAPREYCVQYRETDFDFISRLLEEEGIQYWFRHDEAKSTLVLSDTRGARRPCPGRASVRFDRHVADASDDEVVTRFRFERSLRSARVSHTDYDFKRPRAPMRADRRRTTPAREERCEIYDYPGGYVTRDDGQRHASRREEAQASLRRVARGEGTSRNFLPGHTFELRDHFRGDFDGAWWLHTVEHELRSAHDPRGGERTTYRNRFTALPADVEFRPLRKTPRPVVRGVQTAVVVGRKGEEIWTDEYGRVKVQFHWDRLGRRDENSSCFIRVSQPFAGAGYGGVFTPRVGHEVVVDFLEGDPDRPIIVGRVYHGENLPPYAAGAPTKSSLKVQSTHGGGPGNYSELRFESTAGSEEVYLQGEKDMNVLIKHDRNETIGNSETLQVKVDSSDAIGNNKSVQVGVNRTTQIGANEVVKVGRTVLIDAGESITLRCGASTIHMNQAGFITISGTVVTMAGSVNANVAAPLTNVAGAMMLTNTGAVNLVSGAVTRVEGTTLGHFGGGKAELIGGSETLVQGGTVKIN